MNLLDTTLRDGGNVVGHGFSKELTISMIEGLIKAGIYEIEYGNCKGLGAYEQENATKALTDDEYLALAAPYCKKAHLGMFILAKRAKAEKVEAAAKAGLNFVRVGNNAGSGKKSLNAVKMVKDAGLVCRYSLMKSYLLTPAALANEAKLLEEAGVDKITIMDSAGTMFPDEAAEYVKALKGVVSIPVGFHGHSNLGLSQANALAAVGAGADEIDCGLLGMARSAGNCATELAVATLKRKGLLVDVDFYSLLHYLEDELIPAMAAYHYHVAVDPVSLLMGFYGCHSSILPLLRAAAESKHVPLYQLIERVSAQDRNSPGKDFIDSVAEQIKSEM